MAQTAQKQSTLTAISHSSICICPAEILEPMIHSAKRLIDIVEELCNKFGNRHLLLRGNLNMDPVKYTGTIVCTITVSSIWSQGAEAHTRTRLHRDVQDWLHTVNKARLPKLNIWSTPQLITKYILSSSHHVDTQWYQGSEPRGQEQTL